MKKKKPGLNKVSRVDSCWLETTESGGVQDEEGKEGADDKQGDGQIVETLQKQPTSIMKKRTVVLGERLARLAGYTLNTENTPSSHKVRFNPIVSRFDWRGRIEESLKEEGKRPLRLINTARPINHPLTAGINVLDEQLLPQSIWSKKDLRGCRCGPCNKREEARCKGSICEECCYHPPAFWN